MKSISDKTDKALLYPLGYKSLVDSLTVPTFVINTEHVVIAWNPACELLTGVDANDILGTNQAWRGFYQSPRPCLADVVVDQAEQHLASLYPTHGQAKFSQGTHAESWFQNVNGQRRYMIFDAVPLYDEAGNLIGALENLEDITEIKLAEEQLTLSDKVFNCIHQAIFITNPKLKIIAVNEAFTHLTGYQVDEVVGKDPKIILSADSKKPDFYDSIWQEVKEKGYWEGDVWGKRKGNEIYPEWLSIKQVMEEKTGLVTHYIGLFSDISARKKAELEAQRIAFHDPLTNLPNRLLLRDRLTQAIANAERNQSIVAVVFIDLDNFKWINDEYGHEVGDLLLQALAERWQTCLRKSDTLSRLGGDEFVIITPNLFSKQDATVTVNKLFKAIADGLKIKHHHIDITLSMGVAIYPEDGDNVDTLINSADKAMYAVKKKGKNNIQYFCE